MVRKLKLKYYALKSLKEAYETWKSRAEAKDSSYYDTHCWMFTPSSLRLLLADCHFLGISPFSIDEVSEVNGHEFYAHLRNTGYTEYDEIMTDAYYKHRQSLLHSIRNETSKNSIETFLFKQPEILRESEGDVWSLKKEIDRQNVLIEKILLSRSWRITAVLRKLKKFIR